MTEIISTNVYKQKYKNLPNCSLQAFQNNMSNIAMKSMLDTIMHFLKIKKFFASKLKKSGNVWGHILHYISDQPLYLLPLSSPLSQEGYTLTRVAFMVGVCACGRGFCA